MFKKKRRKNEKNELLERLNTHRFSYERIKVCETVAEAAEFLKSVEDEIDEDTDIVTVSDYFADGKHFYKVTLHTDNIVTSWSE